MSKKCNLKPKLIKVSGLYIVPKTGKQCPRKFLEIRGVSKSRAKEIISARKRLIEKAIKINKKHWGEPRWK